MSRAEYRTETGLATERRQRLRDLLREQRVMRIEQICAEFGISGATARRDLEVLVDDGGIRRVHGGAVSVESRLDEPLFDDKTSLAAAEKRAIAERALEFIKDGDTLYLDGGSTVLELARLLAERSSNLTVVTNSLRAATELSGRGPKLILLGGDLRRRSQTLVGPLTRHILESLYFDRAFMGTIGFSVTEGMTTTDPAEAYTKELAMRHAREVILLADSAKLGRVSVASSGTSTDVDILITDKEVDSEIEQRLKEQGISLICACE